MTFSKSPGQRSGAPLPEPIQAVTDALTNLRFGSIQLTVHEGRIVQLDVTERRRFAQ